MCLLGIAFGMAIVDVGQSLFTNLLFLVKTDYSSMPVWIESLGLCVPVEWVFYILASIVLVVIIVIVRVFVNRIAKPCWF